MYIVELELLMFSKFQSSVVKSWVELFGQSFFFFFSSKFRNPSFCNSFKNNDVVWTILTSSTARMKIPSMVNHRSFQPSIPFLSHGSNENPKPIDRKTSHLPFQTTISKGTKKKKKNQTIAMTNLIIIINPHEI